MEQIKNVGVVEVKMESGIEPGEERMVFHVDPAMCDAEDTARMIVKRGREGKPIVLVIGNAGDDGIARRMLEQLREQETERKTEQIWSTNRHRRVGILGGFGHLPLMALSAAAGTNWSCDYYEPNEDYFNYRLRIRDEEVARGMRRPPKKAICSSRRRGRKFKG